MKILEDLKEYFYSELHIFHKAASTTAQCPGISGAMGTVRAFRSAVKAEGKTIEPSPLA